MTERIRALQLLMARYKTALEMGYITALEYRELTFVLDYEMKKITETFRKSA